MTIKHITASALIALFAVSGATPAFADTHEREEGRVKIDNIRFSTTSMEARKEARASTSAERAEKRAEMTKEAIAKRIKMLEEMSARIGKMGRLSEEQIAAIQAQIQTAIDSLKALESEESISAEEARTTIQATRAFLLVVPQAQVMAAANRILATAGQLEGVSDKLEARIEAAEDAGTDVASLRTTLAHMDAQIADAKVQAQAAIDLVKNLDADSGDDTVKAANTAALKAAREKLKLAHLAIKSAYQDAQTIRAAVAGKGTATTTPRTPTADN